MEQRSSVNGKNVLKFLLFSAFGVLMFLVPIPQGDSFTTLLDFLKAVPYDCIGLSFFKT